MWVAGNKMHLDDKEKIDYENKTKKQRVEPKRTIKNYTQTNKQT